MQPRPVHCRPDAHALFAEQMPRLATRAGLVGAAVAIAKHALPDAEIDPVERRLDALAVEVRERVKSGSSAALLAHAHAVLFEEQRFSGNSRDYYDERNSYLPEVLQRRSGIPITLGLVYAAVLWRLGLAADGVNSAGHFLVRTDVDGKNAYVDAFHGGRMHTRAEALRFLAALHGRALDPASALPVATHRQWIWRMLRNLAGVFRDAHRSADLAAMVELEALLPG